MMFGWIFVFIKFMTLTIKQWHEGFDYNFTKKTLIFNIKKVILLC